MARKILLDQLTGQARSRSELADKLAAKRTCPTTSRPGCSTGSRRSGWSTTRPSPGRGSPAGSRARAWPGGRWPRSCGARASTDEVAREALDEIDPDDEEAAARALVRKKLRVDVRASTAPRRPVGWSGCSPARATRPAWPSRSSRTSSAPTRRAGRVLASGRRARPGPPRGPRPAPRAWRRQPRRRRPAARPRRRRR